MHSAFPFDPGLPQQRLSAILATKQNLDGDIIVDTGAGRGIKPTMSGLTNPTPANSLITWGDGTSAGATIEATLPDHDLPPFLVTPDATCTLVSVGSNVENTTDCYSFFDKHSFRLSGLQVFKDEAGQLDAKFVGPKKDRVKYIATKSRSGDVYKAPSLDVFKHGSNGAWRFRRADNGRHIVIAGPETPADGRHIVIARPETPADNTLHAKYAVDTVFAGMSSTQRSLIRHDLQRQDFVSAYEYTVADLNAHQQQLTMRLIRKHNALGHISRTAMRHVLQQSHLKSDRELARHIHLMPVCNHCLFGKNKKGAKHRLSEASPAEPAKFLQDIAIDNSGKRNIQSSDGYWLTLFIICKRTGFTWVRCLVSIVDSNKETEKWLRTVPKQHLSFRVKTIRHDGGRADFGNKAFERLLEKYNITREQTGGTSTGNAKVERRIGIATADSLTNMSWCHGPRGWWSHSTRYSVTTRNMAPTATNPGHMSPYECAYNKKPNYAMLVPFGCLAFAFVDNKKMHGKTNYRKASRVCAMIGYVLKPDGHPLAYKLYDCDLGTIICRTDNRVVFNVDMPALKFIAERSTKRPVDIYQNATVAKFFGAKLHWGKVVSHRIDTDSELLFRINYEDGDSEELNVAEMMIHTRLAASNARGYDFSVPCAPKSRRRKKLSKILQHAKQLPNENSTADTMPQPTPKLSKILQQQSPNENSIADTTTQPTPKLSKMLQREHQSPDNCSTTDAKQQSIPTPPQATCSTPKSAPRTRRSSRKTSAPDRLTARDLGNVRASIALGKKLFNLDTHDGFERLKLQQRWAMAVAYGAIVEPPQGSAPEIIVTDKTPASSIPIPKTYQEAVTGPYRRYWIEAIRVELENLLSRKVWREEPLPQGAKPVPGRYVWKVKRTDTGTIAKWKVRWIVQGFRQRAGHDYEKTFASVANIVTVRIMLAMACELGWNVYQMDVKAAYLCSKIESNVRMYIKCPDGYKLDPGMYARLLRGLYGTRQGGALWAGLRTRVLKKLKFEQSLAEPSLYTKITPLERVLVTCIVDDFVITGDDPACQRFKREIAKEWEMTDEGKLFWCLNLRVTRDIQRGLLKIDQAQYVDEILKRFNMQNCNPRQTPMREKPVLSQDMCPDSDPTNKDKTVFPYASAIGSLLYLRLTRPDILVAISILARFMKNPQRKHWDAVKDVFKYLKGSRNRGLMYRSTVPTLKKPWRITMWVDSDYGTNPDSRRSRAGFLGYLNVNLITFNSALQRGNKRPFPCDGLRSNFHGVKFPKTPMDDEPLPSMSTGTCDAEYMALSLAVKELIWIYMLLKTMRIPVEKPCVVYEDNRATIKIAENATAMRRTKHIDIRHHFLREHVENGIIKIIPVSTTEQRADAMTKVLGKELFIHFRDILTSDEDLSETHKRTCNHCATVFKSRNKLFQHLKQHH